MSSYVTLVGILKPGRVSQIEIKPFLQQCKPYLQQSYGNYYMAYFDQPGAGFDSTVDLLFDQNLVSPQLLVNQDYRRAFAWTGPTPASIATFANYTAQVQAGTYFYYDASLTNYASQAVTGNVGVSGNVGLTAGTSVGLATGTVVGLAPATVVGLAQGSQVGIAQGQFIGLVAGTHVDLTTGTTVGINNASLDVNLLRVGPSTTLTNSVPVSGEGGGSVTVVNDVNHPVYITPGAPQLENYGMNINLAGLSGPVANELAGITFKNQVTAIGDVTANSMLRPVEYPTGSGNAFNVACFGDLEGTTILGSITVGVDASGYNALFVHNSSAEADDGFEKISRRPEDPQ